MLNPLQTDYEFTLVLSDDADLTEEFEAALYGGRCDDCLISSVSGRIVLAFSRRAESMKDAIISAIVDFRTSGIDADVLFVDEFNLVTQSEIARKVGKSRQWIHQLKRAEGFPSPVCEITEGTPLWYWCEVVEWLRGQDMVDDNLVREANEVALINSALDFHRRSKHQPELALELAGLLP